MRLPPAPYRTLMAGLLVAAAALLAFAWLAQEMLQGDTQQFDDHIRLLVHRHAGPALTAVMRGFSLIGSPAFLIACGALVVVRLVRTGNPRMALLFVITILGAEVLDQVLKLVFHRTRPVAFFGLASPLGYSFPSGHALVSCSFYGVLAAFAAVRTESRARRWLYRIAAALLIAAIGLSRIYLGVHYLSDVLAGYAAAVVWVFSVASARPGRGGRRPISPCCSLKSESGGTVPCTPGANPGMCLPGQDRSLKTGLRAPHTSTGRASCVQAPGR